MPTVQSWHHENSWFSALVNSIILSVGQLNHNQSWLVVVELTHAENLEFSWWQLFFTADTSGPFY